MWIDPRTKDTLVPLILRVALAAIFLYHGVSKIVGGPNDWGANWAAEMWHQKATPPAEVMAKLDRLEKVPEGTSEEEKEAARERAEVVRIRLSHIYSENVPPRPTALTFAAAQLAVAWGELLGGIALLLGLLTRVATVGLIIIQLGAIWTVTGFLGFAGLQGVGYEYNVALIAMCAAVFLLGGGAWSLDRLIQKRAKAPQAQQPAAVPAATV
jgi:uncharacterized membrane protein YphA (DoxX/SURF4 family)